MFGNASGREITSNGGDEARFQMPVHASKLNNTSARSAKTNIESVDPRIALEGVESLEITTWEFERIDIGRHVGPMAEDFAETFGLGDDDESITTIDAEGVALAAIQGLANELGEKTNRIDERTDRIDELKQEVDERTEKFAEIVKDHEALQEQYAALADRLQDLEEASLS